MLIPPSGFHDPDIRKGLDFNPTIQYIAAFRPSIMVFQEFNPNPRRFLDVLMPTLESGGQI